MLSAQERQEYEDWGATPPEHIPHVTEEARDAAFLDNAHPSHTFKQEGIDVFCLDGTHRHGISTHPNKQLIGVTADGHPLFREVVLCPNPLDPKRGIKVDKKRKSTA